MAYRDDPTVFDWQTAVLESLGVPAGRVTGANIRITGEGPPTVDLEWIGDPDGGDGIPPLEHWTMMRADDADELKRLRRWKAEAMIVLDAYDECYEALPADQNGRIGDSKAAVVKAWIEEQTS